MSDHNEQPPEDDLFSDDAFSTRMPHDREAEQAALGGMLLSPLAINECESILGDGAAFYEPHHHTIYQAILALHGQPDTRPDPITVTSYLRSIGDLDRIGGPSYLHGLVHTVPTAANAGWYADIVHTQHRLRRLVQVSTQTAQHARMAQAEPEDILDALLAACQSLLADAASSEPEESLSVADNWEAFVDELSSGSDPTALDSPWRDLNEVVQFKPKELTVVGAATGGGKSLLGMNLAAHIALRRNRPVLVASMEMTRKELMSRLTAAEAGVELDHLIRRKLTDDDWQKIARVSDRLRNAGNLLLDDSAALTVPKIRARVRWMASQGNPPAMVVVDYMQLITPEGADGNASRAQEVAKISRGLKLIADEFSVPVVALAQFNRNAVGRKPLISDFKDSSQIEQDASVILLLHRELAVDGSDTGPSAGTVDVIVGKNRNGNQGREITLNFQGRYGRLRSLAPASWTPRAVVEGEAA